VSPLVDEVGSVPVKLYVALPVSVRVTASESESVLMVTVIPPTESVDVPTRLPSWSMRVMEMLSPTA